ncbi:MAG TPA: TetR/AcrR family transcriptional regulator [Thermoplasmata archaeon]|nr:TetR/AcrR family transcriptional regulator [Thermoplasmata archaeon]
MIDAALGIADREGLEVLSMPRLARELGCGTMTLYDYVRDKGDLLDAVAQRGLEGLRLERPLPSSATGVLEAWGRALRSRLLEHPALASIFLSRPVMGEGIVRGVELLLGALQRAGMGPAAAVRAVYAVLIYTTGFVAWEIPRTRRQPPSAYSGAWEALLESLPPGSTPLASKSRSELFRVAGECQFVAGLTALASGLSSADSSRTGGNGRR